MGAGLHEFLTRDHERLDTLLEEDYGEFRRGLLRHISIEERVLFPELRRHRGVTELEKQLHRDHAALAALLVPPPTPVEIGHIRSILQIHNELEEKSGGLYEIIESLSGDELSALMQRVHAIPEVPVMPNVDSPIVRSSIETLLREAEEGRRKFRWDRKLP